jgi:NADPH-dependent curcumin reductase CurA
MTKRATAGCQVHLVRRPVATPTTEGFPVVDVPLPEPGPGEVLVRDAFLSVDPYMGATP